MPRIPMICRLGAALLLVLGCACGLTSPSKEDGLGPSAADVAVTEGDGSATLTVVLSSAPCSPLTFEVDTHDGSAVAPDDYTAVHADVVVPADSMSATIEIPIVEDGDAELDEWFTVTIEPDSRETARACTAVVTIHEKYPLRTSPDLALDQLELAYNSMCAPAYLDLLAENLEFHLCQDDWQGGELPPVWYKTEEATIHENMFGQGTDVVSVQLQLTTLTSEFDPGPDPVDPADDRWEHTTAVDLRVTVAGCLTYLATHNSIFVFQRDVDEQGPSGEELLEIIEWYELDWYEVRERSAGAHARVGHTTWASVKALFLRIW